MADVMQWVEMIYQAIDELVTDGPPITKSQDTVLLGENGLDSLGLVSLIVSIEEKVQDESGAIVTLADERAFSRSVSPFRTIGTLATYIDELVDD